MGQGADNRGESEFGLDAMDGPDGGIEAGDFPTLIGHAFEEGTAATAKIEQAAGGGPGKIAAAFRTGPAEEAEQPGSWFPCGFQLAGAAMRSIIRGVEQADTAGVWAGIRVGQSTISATHNRKA